MTLAAGNLGCRSGSGALADEKLQFEVYRDSRRQFRWRLKSGNGRVIATAGDAYKTKASCLEGIELVRQGAGTAEIEDQAG